MSMSKNLAKTMFMETKTSTAMRVRHVGEQNTHEDEVFEIKNADINKDGACG